MRYTLYITLVFLGFALSVQAQPVIESRVENTRMERNGDYMAVDMSVSLTDMKVGSNRAVLLTPYIINGNDSVALKSIGIYGRNRYYHYIRNGKSMLSGEDEMTYRAASRPDTVAYHAIIPYKSWMNGSQLVLSRRDYGCCKTLLGRQFGTPLIDFVDRVPEPIRFVPEPAFVRPMAKGEKRDSLCGSAFVDFPVNKTVIYPEYRNNTAELAKINASIDSVRGDGDITITNVWLKGYASPESPYSNNTRLAKGRTAALKAYIQQLYNFDEGIIATEYEPEDWDGLRRYVEQSNLTSRDAILELINSDIDPDKKEAMIKSRYPDDYKFLHTHCYPALRHTDYRIAYVIRSFSDVEEIKRLIKTAPQKLSLNEFYLAAQTYEVGSDEFNEVFETAVRMYPYDEVANLNAANTALQRRDLVSAERYLAKSGTMPEAVYARGLYAAMTDDYDAAESLFLQAQTAGVQQAADALKQLKEVNQSKHNY